MKIKKIQSITKNVASSLVKPDLSDAILLKFKRF